MMASRAKAKGRAKVGRCVICGGKKGSGYHTRARPTCSKKCARERDRRTPTRDKAPDPTDRMGVILEAADLIRQRQWYEHGWVDLQPAEAADDLIRRFTDDARLQARMGSAAINTACGYEIKTSASTRRQLKNDPQTTERIDRLAEEGMPIHRIAKEVGRNRHTVASYLKRQRAEAA